MTTVYVDSVNLAPVKPMFRAYASGTPQSLTKAGGITKIELKTESFDVGSVFDNATNYRFTVGETGLYRITGQVEFDDACTRAQARLYLDGAGWIWGPASYPANDSGFSASAICTAHSGDVWLTKGAYVELFGIVFDNADVVVGDIHTFLTGRLITNE